MGNLNGWNFQNTPAQQSVATLRTIQQVEGEFGIKAYPLRPGESVIAVDSTANDILWIKICNANGVPTIQKVKYSVEETYNPNDNNYVSRKDFNELSAKLDKVLEELNNGNKQSNTQPVKTNAGNSNTTANTNNAKSSNFNERSKNAAG